MILEKNKQFISLICSIYKLNCFTIIVVRLKIVRLKKTFANPKFSGLIKKRGLLFAITEKFYFLESYEFKNYCLSISYNQVFVLGSNSEAVLIL